MALSDGIKRGTVEILLLTLLQQEDMYGYQLAQTIAKESEGLYILQESSMYPTLYRLLDKKCISDREERVGKRRIRVYYHLEDYGKQYLEELKKEYFSITQGVFNILKVQNVNLLEGEDENAN